MNIPQFVEQSGLPWMFCRSLFVVMLSELLATYLGVEFLGQRVRACLVLLETVRPFPKVIVSSTTVYESVGCSVPSKHLMPSVCFKF